MNRKYILILTCITIFIILVWWYWTNDASSVPEDRYLQYNHQYGRLGNRVMAFTFAVQLAKTNRRRLVLGDPLIPLILDVTPFIAYLAKGEPLEDMIVDLTFFRNGNDMVNAKRFDTFLLPTTAGMVDIGIAYDYSKKPVSPLILRSLHLQSVFMEEAQRFIKQHPVYDCLHHRGTDFTSTVGYVPLSKATTTIISHRNHSNTLFISSDEPSVVLQLILPEHLPNHHLYFAPANTHLLQIEGEEWDIQSIGTSLAICAHAHHAFLNPSSTFSHLIEMLASPTTEVIFLSN